MNIATTQFHAIESEPDSCKGCILDAHPAALCPIAWAIAISRGMPMCEVRTWSGKQYIYVADTSDPRQLSLPISAEPGECESLGAADQNNT